ncbi:MAG: hypothetical protein QOK00_2177, partial [Thermoleophilaceae bacterium]|nr:hypothetical protein [Thermoleophilaceae bacterium]
PVVEPPVETDAAAVLETSAEAKLEEEES